jgi:hypothetical protein
MALVSKFTAKDLERPKVHVEIEANYTAFEREGRVYLQIDTSGSSTRQVPGKVSQSIQLNRKGAEALYEILKREFKLA